MPRCRSSLRGQQTRRRAISRLLPYGVRYSLRRAALRQCLRAAAVKQGRSGGCGDLPMSPVGGKSRTINGDGKQTRDYVYVGDVVRANIAALATDRVGVVNIGTGTETDVVTISAFAASRIRKQDRAGARTGEARGAKTQLSGCFRRGTNLELAAGGCTERRVGEDHRLRPRPSASVQPSLLSRVFKPIVVGKVFEVLALQSRYGRAYASDEPHAPLHTNPYPFLPLVRHTITQQSVAFPSPRA